MTLASSALSANQLLSSIPTAIRSELVKALNQIIVNFREERWEPAELNGGKLCEVVYTILRGHVDGQYPAAASKPQNMVSACQALEQATTFPRSVRIQIPRMMIALYEIRNNRGVGHVGGDVDPNRMDAIAVVSMAKWIVAELIRLFHQTDTKSAHEAVELLVTRELQVVWEVAGKKRVLANDLSMADKTLLLLYSHPAGVSEKELTQWVEHSNAAVYRRDVLRKAHRERLLEFDESAKTVTISPKGVRYVEDNIPLTLKE